MASKIYDKIEIPRNDRFTAIRPAEADFIYAFLKDKKIKCSLEVGLAYAASTIHIMAATKKKHYVMDPFQKQNYRNIGLKNIKKFGFEKNLIFEEDFSFNVLPRLLKSGVRVDFAFIDGGHRFDDIFVDFFFVDMLLNKNGYVMFDDLWMRSTQLVVSWIKTNRSNYSLVKIPSKRMILFKKTGEDFRNWYHFKEFYNLKSIISHHQFRMRQKSEASKI